MSDSAARAKRQLLTPSLLRGLDQTQLRERLRTENWDAEDLVVSQVQLAGCVKEISKVKVAVFDGGVLVWSDASIAKIEQLVQDTIAGYEIEDATPFYLDFPLRPQPPDFKRYERFFAMLLLGPRLAIVERGPGGRYSVKPIEPGA